MDFDDIISVSGKPGLYKVLKAGNSGYIVQELLGNKKLVLGNQHRVSFLKEISLYTTTTEGSVSIRELYKKIQKDPGLLPEKISDPNSDLFASLEKIMPNFDAEKIYLSDLKKFFNWFNVLVGLEPNMDFNLKDDKKEGTDKGQNRKASRKKAN